jgi:hypothetical protein
MRQPAKRETKRDKAPKTEALKDLLRGVEAISAYTGYTRRQTECRLARNELPHWREGILYCASRKALDEFFATRSTYRPGAAA